MPARLVSSDKGREVTHTGASTPAQRRTASRVPPASTSAAVRDPRAIASSSKRPVAKANGADVATSTARATPAKRVNSKSSATAGDNVETLLKAISSPFSCTPETIRTLLFMLETTLDDLQISLLYAQGERKAIKAPSASTSRPGNESANASSSSLNADRNLADPRRALIAKQVVNGAIASLNNLATSGWKCDNAGTTPSQSPSDTVGASRLAMTPKGASSKQAQSPKPASPARVLIVFDCFRIAIRYLLQGSHEAATATQMDTISISVIRKIIALECFEAAGCELAWIRNQRLAGSFDDTAEYSMVGNLTSATIAQANALLDAQSLSFVCSLSLATIAKLEDVLVSAVDSVSGPLQTQLLARSRNDVDVKHLDRCAYTVERAVMQCASRQPQLAFLCRSLSLKILLTVSDMDLEAYWDRVLRVGVTHVRSADTKSEQQKVFLQVDGLFKELIQRARQRDTTCRLDDSKAFSKLCQGWTSLARKVGNVESLEFLAQLSSTSDSPLKDSTTLNEAEIGIKLSQICSNIALADTKLAGLETDNAQVEQIGAVLDSTGEDMLAASLLFPSATKELQNRILNEAKHMSRRCLMLLEKAEHASVSIKAFDLVARSAGIVRAAIQTEGTEKERRESTDEYVRTMRIVAKAHFRVSDRNGQDRCFNALNACKTLLDDVRDKTSTLDQAEWRRLTSVSWHYAGAQLYSAKQAGLSNRFLLEAAEMATESCQLWRNVDDEERIQDESAQEGQRHQEEILSKRWEHLGMSYRLSDQPEKAESAYTKAIQSVSTLAWTEIVKCSASMSLGRLFAGNDEDEHLHLVSEAGRLVRVLFEMQTFELQRIERGERNIFDNLLQMDEAKDAVPSMLEDCLSNLAPSIHRQEGPKARRLLIKLALSCYKPTSTPLRRARVLMHAMEIYDDDYELDYGTMAEEASRLLSTEKLGSDARLKKYQLQYRGTLSLLRALRLHTTVSIEANCGMKAHLADACKHFRRLTGCDPKAFEDVSKAPLRRPLRHTSAPRQREAQPAARKAETPSRKVLPAMDKRPLKTSVKAVEQSCSTLEVDRLDGMMNIFYCASELDALHGSPQQSIELLRLGRTIALQQQSHDAYVRLSARLASHYLILGKISKAMAIFDDTNKHIDESLVGSDALARFELAQAESLCHRGKISEAQSLFDHAAGLAQMIDPDARTSGLQGAVQKILLNERQSIAFGVFGKLQYASGNFYLALQSSMNCLKAAMRGGMMLARVSQRSDVDGDKDLLDSPFFQNTSPEAQSTRSSSEPHANGSPSRSDSSADRRRQSDRIHCVNMTLTTLHWRMVKAMQNAYLQLSFVYCARGSVKDAEAFVSECVDFAQRAHTSHILVLALLERSMLRMRMEQQAKAMEDIDWARQEIGTGQEQSMALATMVFVQGEERLRSLSHEEALQHFSESRRILDELFNEGRPNIEDDNGEAMTSITFSKFTMTMLQSQARAHHLLGNEVECKAALARLSRDDLQGSEAKLIEGTVAMQKATDELKRHQIMSLASEAVTSLPVSVQTGLDEQRSARQSEFEGTLSAQMHLRLASDLFSEAVMKSRVNCVSSVTLRNAMLQRAVCHSLLTTISPPSTEGGKQTDLGFALTLEHELEEAIELRLAETKDVTGKLWPSFSQTNAVAGLQQRKRTTAPTSRSPSKRSGAISSGDEVDSSDAEQENVRRDFWLAAKARRQESKTDEQIEVPSLPANWTVVSIALSFDRANLLITRRSGVAAMPISFSIPIDRQSRREGEEEVLGVDAVMNEIREIIDESDQATHSAQGLDGLEARKAWWTRRRELDGRLKELLGSIETTWLGAFKCAVMPDVPGVTPQSLATLRKQIEDAIMKACLPMITARKTKRVQLSAEIFDLFCALHPATCSDEELEDIVHFAMDTLQIRGIAVAVDEVDLDVCVTDVRTALEAFQSRRGKTLNDSQQEEEDEQHVILILDKDTSEIPWESLPCLRGRAVSRIPSLAMLYDRLALSPDGLLTIPLDTASLYYLINPSKELIRTQNRFLPHFHDDDSKGNAEHPRTPLSSRWRGIAGRAPAMDEFGQALESNDVVAYFGHGGAEQFVRPSRFRSMLRCAVTFLWGCSSGVLRRMGEFDRHGTAHQYMLAGCPSLVGNLWDATDKELDRVSERAMRLMGLIKDANDETHALPSALSRKRLSVAQAVAQSRDACKLPYLTGAACVVYGVPVYFRAQQ